MRLIGEAVLEGARAAFECFDDAWRYQDCAEGRVAAGNSLPDQDDVWLDIPVLYGEGLSGAAHAAHDFVCDEEDAVVAADFCDALSVAFGRDSRAEGGADYRFEDEGSYVRGVSRVQKIIKIIRARDGAVGKVFVERAVVAEARCDVPPLGEQRLMRGAAGDVAADGHGAEGAAMIALAAGNNAIALALTAFEMKLSSELDGGFCGFGAAGGETDTAA